MGQGGCDRRIDVFWENSHKKKIWGGGGVGLVGGGGGQGGCERRIEVSVKIPKKKNFFFFFLVGGGRVGKWGGGGGGGSGWM